jgi:hypothetical protein
MEASEGELLQPKKTKTANESDVTKECREFNLFQNICYFVLIDIKDWPLEQYPFTQKLGLQATLKLLFSDDNALLENCKS